MFITFHYQDSSLPEWSSAAQVYRPELSVFSPSIETQAIDHIDVVTTWKGLSVAQAKELCFWQEGFRQAVEVIVEKALLARLEAQNISLDLSTEHARDNLTRIYEYVNSLGCRRVKCNLRQLAEDMLWFQRTRRSQGQPCWLISEGGGLSDILNYLQTLYCFQQSHAGQTQSSGEPHISYLTLDFYAHFSKLGTCLDLLARVRAQPHRLSLEVGENVQMAFHPPVSTTQLSDLYVSGQEGDVYHVTAMSYFPDNVRYERAYRVRLNMAHSPAHNETTAFEHPHHEPKRRAHLAVPSSNPLRSLSNGSARVQGRAVSDIVVEASDIHPEFHETYQDVQVRKSMVLDGKVSSFTPLSTRTMLPMQPASCTGYTETAVLPERSLNQSETQDSDTESMHEDVESNEVEGGGSNTLWATRCLTPSSTATVEMHTSSS